MLSLVVIVGEYHAQIEEVDDAVIVEIAVGVAGRSAFVVLVGEELPDIEEVDRAAMRREWNK